MVRFKNRHILVEFLQPHLLDPTFNGSSISLPQTTSEELHDDDDDSEDVLPRIPDIPFLLPIPSVNGAEPRLKLGDESGGTIYRAIRSIVQDVYGDEGWGRIASSFKVVYHSPLTTLTILRVARNHYRLLWSAIALLTSLHGQPVLPRVVAISGTIKKLQNAAIVYHRGITARLLAVALDAKGSHSERQEEQQRLDSIWEKERGQIVALEE